MMNKMSMVRLEKYEIQFAFANHLALTQLLSSMSYIIRSKCSAKKNWCRKIEIGITTIFSVILFLELKLL